MLRNEKMWGVILSYITLISNVFINLLYTPFLLYHLGDNEYGLYQLMGSLISYFSIFDFGLSNSIIRYYTVEKANKDKLGQENVLFLSLVSYGIISAVLVSISIVIFFSIDTIFHESLTSSELSEAKMVFIIQIITLVISLLSKVFNAVVLAEERFVFIKALSLIQCFLQPLFVCIVILQVPIAISVVVVQAVTSVLINLAVIFYSFFSLDISIHFHGFNLEFLKGMFKLSLSVFFVAITDQIFWKTNQFVLGAVLGTFAVAIYAVSSQIYMNYMAVSSTIQSVFLPRITNLVSTDDVDGVNSLFLAIGKIQFLLLSLILVEFISIGRDFILLWVGEDYIDSFYIAIIIMLAMTIDLIQCIGSTVLQAKNQYMVRAKVLLVCAIVNVIFVCAFAQSGGVVCAAISALCMIIANGPFMNYFYKKIAGLPISSFWQQILNITGSVLVSLLFSIIISIIIPSGSWLLLAIKAVMIFLVYIFWVRKHIFSILSKLRIQ